MEIAPLPSGESARLHALSEYNILDTPPELELDDLTILASHICQTPIALISLIDSDRQWFKSKVGVDVDETPRDVAFCAHAILQEKTFMVEDAASDPRFADNPLVTKDPHIRFYAGAPLITKHGYALGTLCVIDRVPRLLDHKAEEALRALGRQVMALLELRQFVREEKSQNQELLQSRIELKKAELAARGSQKFLYSMLDALSTHIAILDREGTIVGVNEPWKKFANQNYFRGEQVGVGENYIDITKQAAESVHESLEVISGFNELVQAKREYVEVEYPCHAPTEERWFLLRMTRFVADGQVYVVMAHEDVTAQKRTEESLRQSEERFDLAVKGTNDGIWDWMNVNQDAEWWSPQFYNLLGYQPNELSASRSIFKELLHPDDHERTFQAVDDHFEKSEPFDLEYRLRCKVGEYRWFRGRGNTVRDDVGVPLRMAGSIQDITERIKKDEILHAIAHERRLILDNVPALIASFDTGHRYRFANERYLQWFEVTEEALIGKHAREFLTDEAYFGRIKTHMDCAIAGEKVTYEVEVPHSSGQLRWVEATYVPDIDPRGTVKGFFALVVDIHDRKSIEIKLIAQKAELVRSNEDLQQFASVASHDLQEPLRMVSSYTQLLGKRYAGKLDADADEFISYAVDGANRMQRLIRDLLEYSKVGKGSQHKLIWDAGEIVGGAVKNLRRLINETHAEITWDDLPSIRGDGIRLTQVFQNLLGNALKFCDASILPYITIRAESRNAEWMFSVQDNGIGIEADYTSQIFEVFQRLHNRKQFSGTGIGLALCKRIIEDHGGKIWVESVFGKGSTFYFTIAK